MKFIKKYEPFLLFLLFVPVLLMRMNVESTRYCSPDSDYYLEVSRNILAGEGFTGPKVFDYNAETHQLIPLYAETPFGHPDQYEKHFFAVWPLGYPISIVAVSALTSLEPLWASKLLNILLLAADFYLLYLIFAGSSYFPLYYFGSFTMLEICSYTWSENLFLPFFFLFILTIKRIHQSEKLVWKYILLFALSLIGMCLARYASVIFFFAGLTLMLWYYFKKETTKTKSLFWGLALGSLGVGAYLFNNYLQCGYLTGMPRVNTQDFTAYELIQRFFLGIFNQLHIIKQYRFSGTADMLLYLFTTGLQLALMIYIAFLIFFRSPDKPVKESNKLLVYTGFLYLIFLTYMTFTSTIDPFDYRTLIPFSFPVFIAVFNETEERLKAGKHQKAIVLTKLFFIMSLLLNLPKKHILDLLF